MGGDQLSITTCQIQRIYPDEVCNEREFCESYCAMHGRREMNFDVRDSKIPGAGKGLFACKSDRVKFLKDQIICFYKGEIITTQEANRRYPGKNDGDYLFQISGTDYVIDAENKTSCYARYINAAKGSIYKPNVAYEQDGNQIAIVALHDIQDGDEVLVSNYGEGHGLGYTLIDPQSSKKRTHSDVIVISDSGLESEYDSDISAQSQESIIDGIAQKLHIT